MKTQMFTLLGAAYISCLGSIFSAMAQPTVPAPIPPSLAANKVISIYSDAYVLGTTVNSYSENWGQSTLLTQGSIDGNNYLYYTNFNYLGWQFAPINAASMTHLHLDIWADTGGSVRVFPIYGGSGLATDDSKHKVLTLEAGKWNSFDLELATDFAGLNRGSLFQVKFDQGISSFAVDNFYFYNSSTEVDTDAPTGLEASLVSTSFFNATIACKAADNSGTVNFTITDGAGIVAKGGASSESRVLITVTGLTPNTEYNFTVSASDAEGNVSTTALPVSVKTMATPPSAPTPLPEAANVMSLYSDSYTAVTPFAIGNWGQSTVATNLSLSATDKAYLFENFNYVGWELQGGAQDLSAMEYLHIDIWPLNATQFQITPIWVGGEMLYTCTPLKQGEWNSFNIPLNRFTGMNKSNVIQMKMVAQPEGSATVLVDNVYFWRTSSADITAPVMGTATLESHTHNSAIISVSATDNVTSPVVNFVVNDAGNGLENISATALEGKISLGGLSPNTTYNLVVRAQDDAGNISENSVLVSFKTGTFVYFNFATGHLSDSNFGDPNGRILLTLKKESDSSVSIEVKPNHSGAVIDFLLVELNGVGKTLGTEDGNPIQGVITFTNLESLSFSINVLWHTTSMTEGGRWSTNVFAVSESELYVVGNSIFNPTTQGASITCYPNPTTDRVHVSAENPIRQVQVFNLLGQELQRKTVRGTELFIDMENFKAGQYILRVQMEEGSVATRKITKR